MPYRVQLWLTLLRAYRFGIFQLSRICEYSYICCLTLKGPHPNTYTLTKSLGEQIATEYYHKKLPICIVRPSIVTAATAEPYPGWVDNVNGATGMMMGIGCGSIRSLICDKSIVMDVIPVDIVCNILITAAWHSSIKPYEY